ncbi:unnamed protein product [Lasius platythorax]|uniref:Uncharacterized protein n=1 Tax=Lasius platythorax TaxID=488582 RepID=A0AAV2NCF6_9HYME
MNPAVDIKRGPPCTNNNDADGNKNGPQRSSAAAPSPVFHHPSPRCFLYFLRPASYAYFRLPAGIEEQEGDHRAMTEGRHKSRAGTLSRLILAGLTPRHVLRIKLLFAALKYIAMKQVCSS